MNRNQKVEGVSVLSCQNIMTIGALHEDRSPQSTVTDCFFYGIRYFTAMTN